MFRTCIPKKKKESALLSKKSLMFTHDMKNRVYIGPDISKQPTLTCVQTEIRLSLLGGTAEMSAVSFFVYEPVTWLLMFLYSSSTLPVAAILPSERR